MAIINLPPPPTQEPDKDTYVWISWFQQLYTYITAIGRIAWTVIDFTSSNITDIATRNHDDLQNIDGGNATENYHLTLSEYTNLTDGNDTTLHSHKSDFTQTFLMMGA